jgi:hypothetical protein
MFHLEWRRRWRKGLDWNPWEEKIMASKKRGTWGIRFLIHFFTVILGILFFWLEGFLLEDIRSIPGPDYQEIRAKHVEASLDQQVAHLNEQITRVEQEIDATKEEQKLLGDSSGNLQNTINQLLDLQKQSIEKAVALSDTQKESLSASIKLFLENQQTYQRDSNTLTELTSEKRRLTEEKDKIGRRIAGQAKLADKEYNQLNESHGLKLAALQLAILAPLLLVAGYFLFGRRGSIYYPLFVAFGVATALKAALVVHEYFPSQYTKYVLIAILLGIVARILIHFIKIVAAPKIDWLLRQYREAYERFLCPICEYPIRTGPRRFLYWTRRTVHKILPQAESAGQEEPYHCPSCGTTLFETCDSCKAIRHSLLEHCEHCGAKKDVR